MKSLEKILKIYKRKRSISKMLLLLLLLLMMMMATQHVSSPSLPGKRILSRLKSDTKGSSRQLQPTLQCTYNANRKY